MFRRLLPLLLCVFLFAEAASSQTQGVIWDQNAGGAGDWGPSQVAQDPVFSHNSEMADDFDLTGSISEISAHGYNGHIGSPSFPPPFYGVYVRFYAAGQDGKPGAVQAEYFRAANDPGLKTDHAVPGDFRMVLDPPFAASGRHFVSVQPVMDPVFQAYWYWHSANSGAPRGNGAWFRNNLAAEPAWTRQFSYAEMNTDLAFTLYGTRVTPVPKLTRLSTANVPLSGRVVITGEGFGFNRENSVVTVGGVEALLTQWSDTVITAYVPESAPVGTVEVTVTTAGGTSNALPLQVEERPAPSRLRWRFGTDALYSRPAVGSDGTVYAADHRGHLYALTPDGGLKWIYNAEPAHCALPLAVGADGTVYMAASNTLIAVAADGTEKWRVKEPTGEPLFAGPSIGPDGNVYAATSDLSSGKSGLGLFCVASSGALVWSRPGLRGTIGWFYGGQEIRFGSGQIYLTAQTAATPQSSLIAFSANGTPLWNRPGYGQVAVGPDGTVYVDHTSQLTRVAAFGPNGVSRGTFSSAMTSPVAGPDGSVYVGEGEDLAAYDRAGLPRWRLNDPTRLFEPGVSPVNTMIVQPGQTVFGQACFVDGISLSGAPLWRLLLPIENEAAVTPVTSPRFTASGDTVYLGTIGNQYRTTTPAWLYAIDTAPEPGVELPFLSIRPERVGGGFSAGGVVTLPAPAGPGGTVVAITSDNPSATVPSSVTVLEGLRSAAFTLTTRPVTQLTAATVTATWHGQPHTATLTVAPPGPQSVELERWDATGGESFSGKVILNGPAPSGGLKVALQASSAVVKVPAFITIPAGETSANFGVSVSSARGEREVEITASANGLSASEWLWVYPVWLEDLYLEPDPVVGGDKVRGKLILSGPAPEGGLTVYLESENPALLTLPATVQVPEGDTSVTFTGETAVVTDYAIADFWAFTEEDEIGNWIDIIPVGGADQVEVLGAAHTTSKGTLTVEAATTEPAASRTLSAAARRAPAATLTVYDTVTGKAIGKLKKQKNGRYKASFKTRVRPERVTVRSSRGGAATRAVSGQ